jgi:hypothetical protein
VNPVLATERKTPLRESERSSNGRSGTTAQRSQIARRRAIGGGVAVLVLLAVIGFFVTRGGNGGLLGGNSTGPPPAFSFTLKNASFVSVEKGGNPSDQKKAADDAAGGVKGTLDDLYSTAYVDEGTWGDPGEIDDLFTGGATDQIEPNVDVLTLGKDAGDTYAYVDPGAGTLVVKVLVNAKGDTLRAFAKTIFAATANLDDGTFTKLTVTGSFFLVQDGDTWKIESFNVNRVEKPTKAPAASASSPSEVGQ